MQSSDSPPDLKELIRQYRGAAQRREEAECIRLLKELHRVDSGNRGWLDNLERFRKKRFTAVAAECREAIRNDDDARVWKLLDELSGYEGMTSAASLKKEAAEFLRGKRKIEGDADGRKARDELVRAHEAGDVEATVEALRIYRDIAALGFYKQTPADKKMAEQAATWVGREQVKQERQEAFEAKLGALKSELSNPAPGQAVDSLLRELKKFKKPIPKDLTLRAKKAIEARKNRERKQARRRRLGLAGAVAAALIAIAAAVWWLGLQRAERIWAGRLQAAFDRTDLQGFRQLKQELPSYQRLLYGPVLATTTDVEEWLAREDELQAAFEARQASQQRVLQALQSIRDAGFDGEQVQIEAFMSEGRKLAMDDGVLQEVAAFEKAWRDAKQAQLQQIIQRIADAAPADETIDTSRLAEIRTHLDEVGEWIAEGRSVSPVPDELTGALDEWEEKIAAFGERVGGIQEALDALQSSDTLEGYLKGVQGYIEQGAGDPLAEALTKVMAFETDYAHLAEWPPSTAYRPGTARIPFETTPLGRYYPLLGEANHFWTGLLKDLEDMDQTLGLTWEKVKKSIGLLQDDKQLTDLYQYTDALGGRLVFAEGALYGLKAGTPSEASGQMYKPGPMDSSPEFTFRKVSSEHVVDLRQMAHCVFIKNLIEESEALFESEADVFLLSKALELNASTEIVNPLLKLKLMQFIVLQFTQLKLKGGLVELQEILRALQRVDDGAVISWLCVQNPNLKPLNDRAATVLQHHFQGTGANWMHAYRFKRLFEAACAGRGAQFVGTVDMVHRRPSVLQGRTPPELWVLRKQKNGVTAVTVVAERSDAGTYEATLPLVPGEPLLGPGGSVSSSAILARCLELTGMKSPPDDFSWPAVWPVNRR